MLHSNLFAANLKLNGFGVITYSPLTNKSDIINHLNHQELKIKSELTQCKTDHCMSVGNAIYKQITKLMHHQRNFALRGKIILTSDING